MRRLNNILMAALSIQATNSLGAMMVSLPNHISVSNLLNFGSSMVSHTKSKPNRISQKKRRLNHRRKGK